MKTVLSVVAFFKNREVERSNALTAKPALKLFAARRDEKTINNGL